MCGYPSSVSPSLSRRGSILREKATYLLKRDAQKHISQSNRVGLDEKHESKGPQVAKSEAFSIGEDARTSSMIRSSCKVRLPRCPCLS